jgi:hypothetical protein
MADVDRAVGIRQGTGDKNPARRHRRLGGDDEGGTIKR